MLGVIAFIGVQPLAAYKDTVVSRIVILGDVYSVVLMSHDGYLFAHPKIMWLESDFKSPSASERNVMHHSQAAPWALMSRHLKLLKSWEICSHKEVNE